MEPKPTVDIFFKNNFKQEFFVLLSAESAASHQMNESISSDIKLLRSFSLCTTHKTHKLLLWELTGVQ